MRMGGIYKGVLMGLSVSCKKKSINCKRIIKKKCCESVRNCLCVFGLKFYIFIKEYFFFILECFC